MIKQLDSCKTIADRIFKQDKRFSRFLIYPTGVVQTLHKCTHAEWIISHSEELENEFGIILKCASSKPVSKKSIRLEAVKYGFGIVTYQHKSGTLTCDAAAMTEEIRTGVVCVFSMFQDRIRRMKISIIGKRGAVRKIYRSSFSRQDGFGGTGGFQCRVGELPKILRPV
jgi:hypothetical protein